MDVPADETLVGLEVRDQDPQHVVEVAGEHVAFEHFVDAVHRLLEARDPLVRVPVEPYPEERRDRQAVSPFVDDRGVSADRAGTLEQPHAAQAWRRRQADRPGERLDRDPPVGLQRAQNCVVDSIHDRSFSSRFCQL